MTPFFTPTPNPWGAPKIFLAGVGVRMTEVAGEVADGFICHAFTTERSLRETTLPALRRGRLAAGRTMDDFQVVGPSFVVTGADDEELAAADAATRRQIAFYGSTPSYRPVLEQHGWGDLQPELNALSKAGRWEQMASLIDDEILDAFAIVAAPEQIAAELHRRYGDVVQRVSLYLPAGHVPRRWGRVVEDVTNF
jgi:probable F420-dependent oxidoreductase